MTFAAKKISEADELKFADELAAGTTLLHGQFVIEKFLNSGGFGITYLAQDSLKRRVVIKECFPGAFCRRSNKAVGARSRAHQVEFRSIVQLFMQEAFNLAKLKHPNIVGVHQVFEDNDTAYMAMDFVEGFDLQETLESVSEPMTPDQIRSVLDKILDAVAFIHSQGVLHRDISPDNILIDRKTGSPVLIDFGAAREEVSKASRALSEMRVVKDGYSPQEFYINGSLQGPSSDLYAVAATFYHLITKKEPPNAQVRLSAIASREPDPYAPIRGKVPGYTDAFLAAIDKSMNVFPKDRLQSAAEWIAMIDKNAKVEVALTPRAKSRLLSAPVSSTEPKGSAPGKSKSRVVLLGSCAVVVAVLLGLSASPTKVVSDIFGNLGAGEINVAPTPQAEPSQLATPGDQQPVADLRVAKAAPAQVAATLKADPEPGTMSEAKGPVVVTPAAVRPVAAATVPETKASIPVAVAAPVDPRPSSPVNGAKPLVNATPIVQQKTISASVEAPGAPVALSETAGQGGTAAEPGAEVTAMHRVGIAPGPDAAATAERAAVPNNLARVEAMLTHYHTVKLPFAGTSDTSNMIAALTNTAPQWMQPGQRITA
ncbi:MAG: serine/threonine protein kinase, partial [Paracoccaceae bacterium]